MSLRSVLFGNWALKLTSLGLAVLLWAVAAAGETVSQLVEVPVSVSAPPGRSASWEPATAHVMVTGPGRELLKLAASPAVLIKTVPDTASGHVTLELSPSDLSIPRGISVTAQGVEPRLLQVDLDSVSRKTVPVHPNVRVDALTDYALVGGIAVEPGMVQVVGRSDLLARIDSVATNPLRITAAAGPVEQRVALDTAPLLPLRVAPTTVALRLEVAPVARRTLERVPVDAPAVAEAAWTLDPVVVTVLLRGPRDRIGAVTAESLHVFLDPPVAGQGGLVPLRVALPAGFSAELRPDSARLTPRPRG